MCDTILVHIHRKKQLRAALLPYNIYINGSFIGTLRNGKSLSIELPRADAYLIGEGGMPFKDCIVFAPQRDSVLPIEILTKGGWMEHTYSLFTAPCKDAGGILLPLMPAFIVMREAYRKNQSLDTLSQDEKTLLACYNFWISFSDDGALSEIASQKNVVEMLTALRTIGAVRLADFCERRIHEVLGDVSLPLEQIELYEDRLPLLDEGFSVKEINAFTDELRECAAQFLLRQNADQ